MTSVLNVCNVILKFELHMETLEKKSALNVIQGLHLTLRINSETKTMFHSP